MYIYTYYLELAGLEIKSSVYQETKSTQDFDTNCKFRIPQTILRFDKSPERLTEPMECYDTHRHTYSRQRHGEA